MEPEMLPDQKPYALIIGLDSTQGIQTARILASYHVPVIAIAKDPHHYCCRTSVCEELLFASSGDKLMNILKKLGPKLTQKAVLIPCTDMDVLDISRRRDELEAWYHIVLPEAGVIELLMDKLNFYTFAQQEGWPIPQTFLLYNRADAERAAQTLNFPCILKPPLSAAPAWEQNSKLKAYKLATPEEFLQLYDRCKAWADVLIAQEWIEGRDNSLYICNCYFNAVSEPVVTFTSRKIRQWPPQTGECCLGVECQDETVLQETIRMFRRVNYRGLGYLEMKRDERSGKYFIMEPNVGRPTGQGAIAEGGGVELIYTMYCDVLGWPLPANRQQRYEDVKWVFLRRDIQSAFHYWRRGELSLADWWRSYRGKKWYALFSRQDPGPFWGDIYRSIRLFLIPEERKKRNYEEILS